MLRRAIFLAVNAAIHPISAMRLDARYLGKCPTRGLWREVKKRMATLTETEALAICIAPELEAGTKTFGADNAKRACDRMFELVMSKQIDSDTGSRVNSRIGNHSALRQWAVKQGFLPASDAPEDALAKAVKQIHAKVNANSPGALLKDEPKQQGKGAKP